MIEHLSITGGKRLSGEVQASGSKNAALPLMISCLLNPQTCRLRNIPDLDDIKTTLDMLSALGAQCSFRSGEVEIKTEKITSWEARYALVKKMRASFWVLGPLLARTGKARVALPGGDAIGPRPVDIHLEALKKLGANIHIEHGVVIADSPSGLRAAEIEFRFPSVGATHHTMMTAALIPGQSKIKNAAREPEIVQLAEFLSKMGAKVSNAGSSNIEIVGTPKLCGAEITTIGDRIEAATLLAAALMTKGDIIVNGVNPEHLLTYVSLLKDFGAQIETTKNSIRGSISSRPNAINCTTAPFPGLATDIQPIIMAIATIANGVSNIRETIFENRFSHSGELRRLGANISIDGQIAKVYGRESLSGAPVTGGDIRATCSLVLSALAAEGETLVSEIFHIKRGYENFHDKLASLGARINKVLLAEMKELIVGC